MDELPSDYEPCGECEFDHAYEQDEAVRAHRRLCNSNAIVVELDHGQGEAQ